MEHAIHNWIFNYFNCLFDMSHIRRNMAKAFFLNSIHIELSYDSNVFALQTDYCLYVYAVSLMGFIQIYGHTRADIEYAIVSTTSNYMPLTNKLKCCLIFSHNYYYFNFSFWFFFFVHFAKSKFSAI